MSIANCQPVRFLTPKRFRLDGLWFFVPKSKQAIIFIHGLGSTMFWPSLVYKLFDRHTSVLTFNNRGHDKISSLKRIGKNGKITRVLAGAAHEVFTDCVDDIQGAVNFCKKQGIKKIILVGHSTGCQKAVYYLAKAKNQRQISKAVLLCPISDYADMIKFNRAAVIRAGKLARRLVKSGKQHQLLPPDVWPGLHDAQRFLSLYTPNSVEEIFCYATRSRRATALQKVAVPLTIIFSDQDGYLDRPASEIAAWFSEKLAGRQFAIKIIRGANHGFVGYENQVLKIIQSTTAL